MKKEYTVGELAELFGVNAQTLRYYEKIGLFKPMSRISGNDYRCYSVDQIYEFAAIRFYKNCGYSLKEIGNHLVSRKSEESVSFLKERHLMLKERLAVLHKMEEAIRYRLEFIEAEQPNWNNLSIRRKYIKVRGFNPIGAETNIYKSNAYYLYPTIVIYQDGIREFGAQVNTLDLNQEKVRELDAGNFLCCFHVGNYETITKTQNKLKEYAKKEKIKTEKYYVTVNHVDPLLERNPMRFITDIQLRIIE